MEAQYMYVSKDGLQEGPVPLELVLALMDAGDLGSDAKVMDDATGCWMTLTEAQQQQQQPAPTPAPKPQTLQPTWAEQWRAAQAADNRT
jgi:hypothetical protein